MLRRHICLTQRGGFVIHKSVLKSHSEQGCVDGINNKMNWKVLTQPL